MLLTTLQASLIQLAQNVKLVITVQKELQQLFIALTKLKAILQELCKSQIARVASQAISARLVHIMRLNAPQVTIVHHSKMMLFIHVNNMLVMLALIILGQRKFTKPIALIVTQDITVTRLLFQVLLGLSVLKVITVLLAQLTLNLV